MSFLIPARAERRALLAFGLVGAGLGLGLGAAYMVAGMGQAAAEHARQAQLHEALTVAFSSPAGVETLDAGGQVLPKHSAVAAITRATSVAAKASDLDCLTAAVYYEARGETPRGQAAVAQVVLNRVLHPAFPKTVCAVVYQGAKRGVCQFSFACDGIADRRGESGAWKRARRVALAALDGTAADEIGRATHFHAARVNPHWGQNMARVAQIGLHVFYRFGSGAPAKAAPAEAEQDDVKLASFSGPGVIHAQVALLEPAVHPAGEPTAAKAETSETQDAAAQAEEKVEAHKVSSPQVLTQ